MMEIPMGYRMSNPLTQPNKKSALKTEDKKEAIGIELMYIVNQLNKKLNKLVKEHNITLDTNMKLDTDEDWFNTGSYDAYCEITDFLQERMDYYLSDSYDLWYGTNE